ncbi:hypothetical protein [Priestia megaterium]|uniref:hypothetical protein n=1 Tax=Priestia megaterium TaxID=1404 RepID=UPI000BF95079|nr:hypothetical protein [Priestia megaterium]PFR88899.1 hypothetical protein COK39_25650 [Priestia megaterium]
MKFVFKIEDQECIDYIKGLDEGQMDDLKIHAEDSLMDYIHYKIEQRDFEKKQHDLEEKQRKCEHRYKETKRDSYDEDGEPYFDDDGIYSTVERVVYTCSKCDHVRSKMEYSD